MSAPARIYQQLSLDDIDPPALASRETVDERALEELAQSIARVGLIQAIGVRRCGARYQVVYGHRRFLACQMIGTPTIECVIVGDGDVSPEALKIIENAEREAVNPAEEAAMLHTLLANDCGGDTDVLARLLHRSREYVESRLLLLAGDRDVLAALRAGKITLSVARELNMMRAGADMVTARVCRDRRAWFPTSRHPRRAGDIAPRPARARRRAHSPRCATRVASAARAPRGAAG